MLSQWQPISTAPTGHYYDDVLVARFVPVEADDAGHEWRCIYKAVARRSEFSGQWEMWSNGMDCISGGTVLFKLREPTHWMPIQKGPFQ